MCGLILSPAEAVSDWVEYAAGANGERRAVFRPGCAGVQHIVIFQHHPYFLKTQGQGARSGMRVVIVRPTGIQHRFYELSELPNSIDLSR